jgi:hypothetical protein
MYNLGHCIFDFPHNRMLILVSSNSRSVRKRSEYYTRAAHARACEPPIYL